MSFIGGFLAELVADLPYRGMGVKFFKFFFYLFFYLFFFFLDIVTSSVNLQTVSSQINSGIAQLSTKSLQISRPGVSFYKDVRYLRTTL